MLTPFLTLAALVMLGPQDPSPIKPSVDPIALGTLVGQVLPDIELPTIDRSRTVRLSDYRGQRVLLLQFASW